MIKDKNGIFCNSPIHGWFGLTYASWLTLPRVVLEAMPLEWQEKFVGLMEQADELIVEDMFDGGTINVRYKKNGKYAKMPPHLNDYRHPDHEWVKSLFGDFIIEHILGAETPHEKDMWLKIDQKGTEPQNELLEALYSDLKYMREPEEDNGLIFRDIIMRFGEKWVEVCKSKE